MKWWEKLSRVLVWLTIFVLPWQFRHTFLFAEHNGEFFEYASLSLYLSDILIGLLLAGWLWEYWHTRRFIWGPWAISWPLGLLIIWMWVTVLLTNYSTGNLMVAAVAAGHFTWFYLFYLYLVNHITDFKEVIWPLLASLALQGGIALVQFFSNHSLGLRWLGESVLDPEEVGIPVVVVDGARQLRAHGTLPHANILGGILAFSLPIILGWYGVIKKDWQKWLVWGVLALVLVACLLSFSRGAWLAGGIGLGAGLIWMFLHNPKKLGRDLKLGLAGVILLILVVNEWPAINSRFNTSELPLERESVISRVEQLQQFDAIYKQYPWQGIGIGQYTLELERKDVEKFGWHYDPAQEGWVYNLSHQVWDYQPVHNLFLMVLAELGWIGFGLFISIILGVLYISMKLLKQYPSLLVWGVGLGWVVLLISGLFDHYLWTLQQGRLILFLGMGLIALLYQISIKDGVNYGRREN